jgi:predicted outer membrane repeat protein
MKSRLISVLLTGLALSSLIVTSFAAAQIEAELTFTATSTDDVVDSNPGDGICETASGNGVCTLRAAVMEANAHAGADTILLPEATYTLTIPGADEDESATGDLDITEGVTIQGAVETQSDINAAGLGDRVLDIHSTADPVRISWIVVTGGSATMGGGIYNKGHLDLSEVVVYENEADNGGGIYSSQALTLAEVIVVLNSAVEQGGGAYIAGDMKATNCYIMNNEAGGYGGGAFLDNGTVQSILNSHFSYNDAESGGGIFNEAELTLKDSQLYLNAATFGGGAIANYFPGNLILENVSIYENNANQYAGGIRNVSGSIQGHEVWFDLNTSDTGGALTNSFSGVIELSRASFSNNHSEQSGGAIFNGTDAYLALTDSTIISNTAGLNSGGIGNEGTVDLIRVTITDNQAESGGGIRNYSAGELSLVNSTLSGNSADLNGGGIYNEGKVFAYHDTIARNEASDDPLNPSGSGGGVFNVEGVKFIIQDTILFANHRKAIFLEDNDCYGTLLTQHYNLVGTLDDCVLDGDQGLDLIGIDPRLGMLADNGGPTWTLALQPDSPAIDAANPAGCFDTSDALLTTDQRGHPLPWDGDADGTARCDIGAFEAPLTIVYLPMTVK